MGCVLKTSGRPIWVFFQRLMPIFREQVGQRTYNADIMLLKLLFIFFFLHFDVMQQFNNNKKRNKMNAEFSQKKT